jgi:ABC-type lipoprotein release transport system permease subunit
MISSPFFNFITLLLFRHRNKHIAIFIISTIIVSLLSSIIFISKSIQRDTKETLKAQPDFIIQKIEGGREVDTPIEWAEEFAMIEGVSHATPRVYGRYFLKTYDKSFMIVGVDFFDEQVVSTLKKVVDEIDIKEFLKTDSMIVGDGVKKYLKEQYYEEYFNFFTPDGEQKKVTIFSKFTPQTEIITNDMILMPIELAKEILGIDQEQSTDIILNVPNEAERDNVAYKLDSTHFNIRVIQKDDISKEYQNLYNYKGGIFLLLFTLSLLTFMLILYQRYSMIGASDKKEIGILRALGWSIKDILKLKVLETLSIGIWAFILGIIIGYIFVFIFNAPLLKDIFLGTQNLEFHPHFTPIFDFGIISSLFLFFIIPFITAIIIPVWRIAITDPYEVMR